MLLGLRTVIHPAPDLAEAKRWFTELLGKAPYFDEPFYVGFEVGGYELGLDPSSAEGDPVRTYWGVADAEAALARLTAAGGTIREPLSEVGDGIRVASVVAVGGGVLGVIENPHFVATPVADAGPGPGR